MRCAGRQCLAVWMLAKWDSYIYARHAKNDGECEVTSDCFIHAHTDLFIHLAMLMTSMFSHSFIISNLKFGTIKPIPKNRYNLNESSNYRSIAISSVLGKLIDRILLDRLSEYLISSDMQFGFKPVHSTTVACVLLFSKRHCLIIPKTTVLFIVSV
jgi:hypothetical protein